MILAFWITSILYFKCDCYRFIVQFLISLRFVTFVPRPVFHGGESLFLVGGHLTGTSHVANLQQLEFTIISKFNLRSANTLVGQLVGHPQGMDWRGRGRALKCFTKIGRP